VGGMTVQQDGYWCVRRPDIINTGEWSQYSGARSTVLNGGDVHLV